MTDFSGSTDFSAEREQAFRELEASRKQLLELQRTIATGEKRLHLLDKLLTLAGKSAGPNAPQESFLDACERILRLGGPVRITDLRQALLDDGITLPGQGTSANVILQLQRAKRRFVRVRRGWYTVRRPVRRPR